MCVAAANGDVIGVGCHDYGCLGVRTSEVRISEVHMCTECLCSHFVSLVTFQLNAEEVPPRQALVTGVFPSPRRYVPSFVSLIVLGIPAAQLFMLVYFHRIVLSHTL